MATLRRPGIPVERLTPDEVAARWPQMRTDDPRSPSSSPRPGSSWRGAGSRPSRARSARRAARSSSAGRSRAGRTGAGCSTSSRRWRAARGRDRSCSPAGRGCRGSSRAARRPHPRRPSRTWCSSARAPATAGSPRRRIPCWRRLRRRLLRPPVGRRARVQGRARPLRPGVRPDRRRPDRRPRGGAARAAVPRRRFPGLADAPVVETRVCQYETTPDSQFLIDRHPGFETCGSSAAARATGSSTAR